jgi:hypothetical protein
MISKTRIGAGMVTGFLLCVATAPEVFAANVKVTVDTPFAFRATFTGTDTDPSTIGGNDFQKFEFDFWTVLVNLRGDGVDGDGNAFGFYEIQLTHSGRLPPNPDAPIVKTFLLYNGLAPATTLTDGSVSSQPNGSGVEYLNTTVNILFDPGVGTVQFNGTIAGDTDSDGDGILDSSETDKAVEKLNMLRETGLITGKEMGQIIKQTVQIKK